MRWEPKPIPNDEVLKLLQNQIGVSRHVSILLAQRTDLSNSIDDLLNDISNGTKIMKVYRQMKMYNDDSLNPILYHKKEK